MSPSKHRVCPVNHAGALSSSLRQIIHNPRQILVPFLKPGKTALDFGCGPGFFTLAMADLVGASGRVIAADLQAGMLEKLREKIRNTGLETIITLHQTKATEINLPATVDFVLLFYVLHELPDQAAFFQELKTCLRPGAHILLAEPKWHVSSREFQKSLYLLRQERFEILPGPKIFFSRTAVARANALPAL
jgi:ubiquinone/menaquinone biosynthesis C-methylase UbiE